MAQLLIQTEDAKSDLWILLSQYTYPANIEGYFASHNHKKPNKEMIDFISGSILQAQAYYAAAEKSPLSISPLLLYYGTSNLLAGTHALIKGDLPQIEHHGMIPVFPMQQDYRIADLEIKPCKKAVGSLQIFSDLHSNGCQLVNGETWSVEEILGGIPDLKLDFENVYQHASPYCLPVEVVLLRNRVLERIYTDELNRFDNVGELFARIQSFEEAYLAPQIKKDFVIIFPKLNSPEIGTRSIFGKKYLEIGHNKAGALITPSQLILLYMGLFAFGYVSRYKPEIWNRFVTSDLTGERLLIEKFLAICRRMCPNFALNALRGQEIQFVYEIVREKDLRTSLSAEEIRRIERLRG